MLKTGADAPDFELESADGGTVRLQELLKKGPVVLYFYPADFTPGCTKQACMFRDIHSELAEAGVQVVGISPQSLEEHRRFREQYNLPFPLLSDPDKRVIKRYDTDGPFGLGVRRTTYLIDRAGKITDILRADFNIARHQQFAERAIQNQA
jgi:peroxiredoxin Q/BCP